jgi:formylglycine-generating enzyme required for sulfatase activity
MQKSILIIFLFLVQIGFLRAQESKMASIKEGSFVPLYGATSKNPVKIKPFFIDVYPVTNKEYLSFLRKNPNLAKSKIKVTNVSWFTAKKYCECLGKRLPTMDEWEYVAMADEKKIDARTRSEFNKYILSWYEKSKTYENPIGQTFKNYWGVYDMHGLVWEWTADFNSIFLSGESRKDKSEDKNLFCGGASVNANDLMDYAAFMRYAFRGSLKAQYSTRNLGFRCASTTQI